jgi:hypothetical protein
MHDGVALRFDYLRSASRGKGRAGGAPVWAAEFQGGPVSTGFQRGRVPAPDDIRRWMLTAVGSGVTGISFWVTRAEIMAMEMNGFSLLDSTGDTTPRLEEAARVGAALNRHPDLFGQPTFPPASVAILVNEWNWQHCAAMTAGGEHLSYSVRGWYRLLWDAGVPVDFLEASELDEPRAHAYRALILPFPLSLSETVAGRLAGRVRAGVNLVCEAGPGLVNEHGFCNRGEMSPAMAELFGARPASFQMVREPRSGQRWSPQERTWGEYLAPAFLAGIGPLAGKRLRANGYIQTFTPIGGTPCLRYGKAVAGVTRKVGEGTAWLIGTYVGHAGTAYRNPPSAVCVRTLLARCGVQPAHRGTLLLRKRVLPGKEAWLFTNPTAQALSEIVDVTGWSEAEDLLGEPLERTANRVSLTVNGLDVRVLIVRRP